MVAGVPAAVGIPGQDAVIAGTVAGTAGQRELNDSTSGPYIEAVLGAREDRQLAMLPLPTSAQPPYSLPLPRSY